MPQIKTTKTIFIESLDPENYCPYCGSDKVAIDMSQYQDEECLIDSWYCDSCKKGYDIRYRVALSGVYLDEANSRADVFHDIGERNFNIEIEED